MNQITEEQKPAMSDHINWVRDGLTRPKLTTLSLISLCMLMLYMTISLPKDVGANRKLFQELDSIQTLVTSQGHASEQLKKSVKEHIYTQTILPKLESELNGILQNNGFHPIDIGKNVNDGLVHLLVKINQSPQKLSLKSINAFTETIQQDWRVEFHMPELVSDASQLVTKFRQPNSIHINGRTKRTNLWINAFSLCDLGPPSCLVLELSDTRISGQRPSELRLSLFVEIKLPTATQKPIQQWFRNNFSQLVNAQSSIGHMALADAYDWVENRFENSTSIIELQFLNFKVDGYKAGQFIPPVILLILLSILAHGFHIRNYINTNSVSPILSPYIPCQPGAFGRYFGFGALVVLPNVTQWFIDEKLTLGDNLFLSVFYKSATLMVSVYTFLLMRGLEEKKLTDLMKGIMEKRSTGPLFELLALIVTLIVIFQPW